MITFSVNKNFNEVVKAGILTDLRPTTDIGREWLSEVWIKTLEGKTDDKINIDAYGYACEENTKKAISKKEVALLTVEEIDEGLKGVADTVASYIDTNVDMIVESAEVKNLVDEFLEAQEEVLLEEGVNLWKVLKLAREANTKMIDKLRYLMEQYSLAGLVEDILMNNECMKKLEEVMA